MAELFYATNRIHRHPTASPREGCPMAELFYVINRIHRHPTASPGASG